MPLQAKRNPPLSRVTAVQLTAEQSSLFRGEEDSTRIRVWPNLEVGLFIEEVGKTRVAAWGATFCGQV